MKKRTRQKLRLIVNIGLTIFSLFALTISLFAWFSNNRYAEISSLNMRVEQKEFEILDYPESIILPCATKLDDVTKEDFNSSCIVVAKYVLKGEVSAVVSVKNDNGLLGYVWDGVPSAEEDYFSVIKDSVSEYCAESPYTYDSLKNALDKANVRSVGEPNIEGNTEIYIVFWGDYNKLSNDLNSTDNNGDFVYQNISLNAELSFVL